MRSPARFACLHCHATRVTVAGIESHVRSQHRERYADAVEFGLVVFTRIDN